MDAIVAIKFRKYSKRRTMVAAEAGHLTVAQIRQKGRRGIAVVAEWMRNGRPMVAT